MYRSAILLFSVMFCASANAQVENMPQSVQDLLAEVGPIWEQDRRNNVQRVVTAYLPLLEAAPKDGVLVTRDISYGSDPLQKLDVFSAENLSNAPILLYIHGGAYTRGSRAESDNILFFFARHGMIGVNADYRLAPDAPWPAGPEDVGRVVEWVKNNAAQYGGDTERIYLMGASAGATHIASYVFDTSFQANANPGAAGMVLISGRYRIAPQADDPNFESVQAYFGSNPSLYQSRSPITHVDSAPRIPTFIVVSEYDNRSLDVLGAELFAAMCERDGSCPRFTRLEHHNHISSFLHFNTADEELGLEIIDFIRRGR